MARSSSLQRKDGYSLIEVLIASLVLSAVFVSSIAAMTMGYRMMESARFNTLAGQVIQSEIETLRLMNWTQVSALPSSQAITIDNHMTQAGFNKFSGTRVVTNVRAKTKRIIVAVQWTAISGQSHTKRYTTFMTKDGLNDYYYTKI